MIDPWEWLNDMSPNLFIFFHIAKKSVWLHHSVGNWGLVFRWSVKNSLHSGTLLNLQASQEPKDCDVEDNSHAGGDSRRWSNRRFVRMHWCAIAILSSHTALGTLFSFIATSPTHFFCTASHYIPPAFIHPVFSHTATLTMFNSHTLHAFLWGSATVAAVWTHTRYTRRHNWAFPLAITWGFFAWLCHGVARLAHW